MSNMSFQIVPWAWHWRVGAMSAVICYGYCRQRRMVPRLHNLFPFWWYVVSLDQRRQWHPTPVLLPGKSHGWRSLVGRSPWGRTESDTTEATQQQQQQSLQIIVFLEKVTTTSWEESLSPPTEPTAVGQASRNNYIILQEAGLSRGVIILVDNRHDAC